MNGDVMEKPPAQHRHGHIWTKTEDDLLLKMHAEGLDEKQIAEKLRRRTRGITMRLQKLQALTTGIPPEQRQEARAEKYQQMAAEYRAGADLFSLSKQFGHSEKRIFNVLKRQQCIPPDADYQEYLPVSPLAEYATEDMKHLSPSHPCHIFTLLREKKIGMRTYNVLHAHGIYDIRVAKQIPPARLLKLPNFGSRSMCEITNLELPEVSKTWPR